MLSIHDACCPGGALPAAVRLVLLKWVIVAVECVESPDIARQQRDPYVKLRRKALSGEPETSAPQPASYASRAAFKLIQLDDIHNFLRPRRRPESAPSRSATLPSNDEAGQTQQPRPRAVRPHVIVDLGAAPGGWTQVAVQRTRARAATFATSDGAHAASSRVRVFALDILPVDAAATEGATFLQGDFLDPDVQARLEEAIRAGGGGAMEPSGAYDTAALPPPAEVEDTENEGDAILTGLGGTHGMVDVVLSDMMASTTGNPIADTEASLHLCRSAFLFAARNLRRPSSPPASGGNRTSTAISSRSTHTTFVCKFFGSPAADHFRRHVLEPSFERVKVEKGRVGASRKESREAFWVCQGFRGPQSVNLEALYGGGS
ncbi:2' O-ribose methyltransferase [Tilletia horrida]|uniref:rRNA methyltransferase 2, mitochondrial n=1 Tax=Tilletia horrida TaxID=155126 RepID=A0AAN6G628_9BASI|nr:2' O-ribose methyltransferase [Tilletia horrida]